MTSAHWPFSSSIFTSVDDPTKISERAIHGAAEILEEDRSVFTIVKTRYPTSFLRIITFQFQKVRV